MGSSRYEFPRIPIPDHMRTLYYKKQKKGGGIMNFVSTFQYRWYVWDGILQSEILYVYRENNEVDGKLNIHSFFQSIKAKVTKLRKRLDSSWIWSLSIVTVHNDNELYYKLHAWIINQTYIWRREKETNTLGIFQNFATFNYIFKCSLGLRRTIHHIPLLHHSSEQ